MHSYAQVSYLGRTTLHVRSANRPSEESAPESERSGTTCTKEAAVARTAKYFVFNVRAENMLESSGYCWLVVTHEWWEDTFHAAPVPNV
jgi:hypothetical protein